MNKKLIQLISQERIDSFLSGDISINQINKPDSLDMYQINIIDLRNPRIWENNGASYKSLNISDDLRHLAKMVKNSKDTKIIYIYPEDTKFYYYYSTGRYQHSCNLKNILPDLEALILGQYLNLPLTTLTYERTHTQVSSFTINSDFYFNIEGNVLTKSLLSNKATTIEIKNIILTTLSFQNAEELVEFLKTLNLITTNHSRPSWIDNVLFLNDNELRVGIQENIASIKIAESKIEEAKALIDKNNKYKSILYLNGNELVNIIFEILEEILGCDLKGFVDSKNEDFLIELKDVNFLGEIKGVSTNVKSEYISQLDVHYQKYLENEKGNKSTKSILIICHQRNKELSSREQIHENQIQLAKRNGSLIIETTCLLAIYESFLLGKITTDEIIKLFHENTGLLNFSVD